MRNLPEFILAFFAIHRLGAVPALVNAWLPAEQALYCLRLADPRVIVVDGERSGILSFSTASYSESTVRTGRVGGEEDAMGRLRKHMPELVDVFVVRGEGRKHPFTSLESLLPSPSASSPNTNTPAPIPPPNSPSPDSPATLFFTSGTTGQPKAVLSSQRGFLGNTFGLIIARARAVLRAGGGLADVWGAGEGWVAGAENKTNREGPNPAGARELEEVQKAVLLAVPMFHVTGTTSTVVSSLFVIPANLNVSHR